MNYLILFLFISATAYLVPDKEENLIALLIFLVVLALLEVTGKNIIIAVDEERKKLKLKFDMYHRIKKKTISVNIFTIDEVLASFLKKAFILEVYVHQEVYQNISCDFLSKTKVHVFATNTAKLREHKKHANSTKNLVESFIKEKFLQDLRTSIKHVTR